MSCQHMRRLIAEQFDRPLDPAEVEVVQVHLQTCDACRLYERDLRRGLDSIRALPGLASSGQAWAALEQSVQRSAYGHHGFRLGQWAGGTLQLVGTFLVVALVAAVLVAVLSGRVPNSQEPSIANAPTPTTIPASSPTPSAPTPTPDSTAVTTPTVPPETTPAPVNPAVTTNSPDQSLRMIDATVGWVVNGRNVLRTTDGGATWNDVTPPGISSSEQLGAWVGKELVVDFVDAWTAFVAPVREVEGKVTIYRTNDGGQTWTTLEAPARTDHGPVHPKSLDFVNSEQGWLMVEPQRGMNSSPGDLLTTSDGGTSWTLIATTDDTTRLPFGGEIRFRDQTMGWLLGNQVSTALDLLFITRDAGRTWEPQSLALPPGLPNGTVDVDGLPIFFQGTETGVLQTTFVPESGAETDHKIVFYFTDDGGETWQSSTPGGTGVLRHGPGWDFISPDEGWLWSPEPRDPESTVAVQGKLYHTTDGGRSWEAIDPDETLAGLLEQGRGITRLDFITPARGVAVAETGELDHPAIMLRTEDGGRTWTDTPLTPPPFEPLASQETIWGALMEKVGGTIDPVLKPSEVPGGLDAIQLQHAAPGAFQVVYNGHGKQLRIGVAGWNPPLCGAGCGQRQVVIRGQRATLQVLGDAHAPENVWLWWEEPGRWEYSGLAEPAGIFYLISAQGLTPDEVVQVAASLTPVEQTGS